MIFSMDKQQLESPRVRRAFDKAAQSYDTVATLQRRAADRLLTLLPEQQPERILDAGCGTGYLSGALAQRFPTAQITGLDIAPGMLAATRQRTRSSLVCADMHHLPLAAQSVNLLCSNLMLQWCDPLEQALREARRCLQTSGIFSFSTFGASTLRELRGSFSDSHTHISQFVGAENLEVMLVQAGFTNIRIEVSREVAYYPDAYALMRELKTLGAGNATAGRARGLTGKKSWQTMLANYEKLRTGAGLPATYELIYALAQART